VLKKGHILVVLAFGISVISILSISAEESLDTYLSKTERIPTINDPNLKFQIIQTGLSFPTKFTFINDSTILVAQKNDGKIRVIKNFQLQDEPALDLNVEADGERGLSGLEE